MGTSPNPTIRVYKIPNCNKSYGLGTGEIYAGVGVELTKWFGDVHLAGEGMFTYQGRADGFGLKNYFSYTGGSVIRSQKI